MKAEIRPYRSEHLREVQRLMGSADGLVKEAGATGVVAESDGSIVDVAFGSVNGGRLSI